MAFGMKPAYPWVAHSYTALKFCQRPFPKLLALLTLLWACLGSQPAEAFGLADVEKEAAQLAAKPYRRVDRVPDFLAQLDFDQWSRITFKPDQTPWPQSNKFLLYPSHPGYLFVDPVRINLVDAQGAHEFSFKPSQFDYKGLEVANRVVEGLGFAGFKLLYPINDPQRHEEFITYQGASYFRAVGRKQWMGLSARGVAINTGISGGRIEEFPYFRTFWIERPASDANSIRFYALLDGESLTAAYEFAVYPGEQTLVNVKATFFMRKRVQKLGLAPLTSMFIQGENSERKLKTDHPEEHDSDGLSINTAAGEWIWRPLQNPTEIKNYAFTVGTPKGFGLMQRDRDPDHYQSLNLFYQLRPSAWIVPEGNWGPGRVEVIEIPSNTETMDNMVAFWTPEKQPAPGQPLHVAYRIYWQGDNFTHPDQGWVTSTLSGAGPEANTRQYAIDFVNVPYDSNAGDITAVVDVGQGGALLNQRVERNPNTQGWRLNFTLRREPAAAVQLKAYLQQGNRPITETWDYVAAP